MGASLTLPVQHGRLALGTWQVRCGGAVHWPGLACLFPHEGPAWGAQAPAWQRRALTHMPPLTPDNPLTCHPHTTHPSSAQGIYLNEHRNYGGPRRLVITVQGVKRADGRKYSPYTR